MSGNSFGRIFRLATYGESHGPGLGGIVEGCPAGIELDEGCLQKALDERRPGFRTETAASGRREADAVKLLSGVFNGKTTGAPIAFHIENTDARPQDYENLKDVFRPGHADFPWHVKYGARDFRGGGRSSGRETASRVAGGAIARAFLRSSGISLNAYTIEYGGIQAEQEDPQGAANRPFYAPSDKAAEAWSGLARQAREEGDSLGGIVRLCASGLPTGLGEPVFDKLDARLAGAMFSVGAVKGVEFGAGFAAARGKGSSNNDGILPPPFKGTGCPQFASNNAGGILGGLSTGQDILVNVAVKPIPSIAKLQQTINNNLQPINIQIEGRHDVSAIPRIVPVLKAMLALVLADFMLLTRCSRL